jgi:hypothetical protein
MDGGIDPILDGSPKRCPADDKNGAANGNNDDNDAPLRPPSYTEPRIEKNYSKHEFCNFYLRGTLR